VNDMMRKKFGEFLQRCSVAGEIDRSFWRFRIFGVAISTNNWRIVFHSGSFLFIIWSSKRCL